MASDDLASIRHATDDQRARAYVIDSGLFLIPIGVIVLFYLSKRHHLDRDVANALTLFVALIYLMYRAVMHARRGQTLGKALLGIRVVRLDGRPAGWREALLRQTPEMVVFLFAVPYLLGPAFGLIVLTVVGGWMVSLGKLWLLVDILTLVYRADNRALHDLLGGTMAVRSENPASLCIDL